MSDFHKLDPDHFDLAAAEAHGAIAGTMYGNGHEDEMPHLTPMLKTAYENAFKVAYNRGYEAAVAQWGTPPAAVPAEAEYLIWSHHHRMWFAPKACGYRREVIDAGRFTLDEANRQRGRRGCECCLVPEIVIPAPELALFAVPGAAGDWTREQIKLAMQARVDAGEVNRHAAVPAEAPEEKP